MLNVNLVECITGGSEVLYTPSNGKVFILSSRAAWVLRNAVQFFRNCILGEKFILDGRTKYHCLIGSRKASKILDQHHLRWQWICSCTRNS